MILFQKYFSCFSLSVVSGGLKSPLRLKSSIKTLLQNNLQTETNSFGYIYGINPEEISEKRKNNPLYLVLFSDELFEPQKIEIFNILTIDQFIRIETIDFFEIVRKRFEVVEENVYLNASIIWLSKSEPEEIVFFKAEKKTLKVKKIKDSLKPENFIEKDDQEKINEPKKKTQAQTLIKEAEFQELKSDLLYLKENLSLFKEEFLELKSKMILFGLEIHKAVKESLDELKFLKEEAMKQKQELFEETRKTNLTRESIENFLDYHFQEKK